MKKTYELKRHGKNYNVDFIKSLSLDRCGILHRTYLQKIFYSGTAVVGWGGSASVNI